VKKRTLKSKKKKSKKKKKKKKKKTKKIHQHQHLAELPPPSQPSWSLACFPSRSHAKHCTAQSQDLASNDGHHQQQCHKHMLDKQEEKHLTFSCRTF
jgi:hypothetical protein